MTALVFNPMLLNPTPSAYIATVLHGSHALGAWDHDPGVVLALFITAALYGLGLHRIFTTGRKAVSKHQIGCFAGGWLVLVVAVASPLHELGSALFSAHMTQHELLMLVVAPLLVLGRPDLVMLWAFPLGARSALLRVFKVTALAAIGRTATAPMLVWLMHGVSLWVWHVPALYQATLRSEAVHAAQHLTFLGTALLFWWTLVYGRRARLSYGAAVAYIFTTAIHTSVLGALLTFSSRLWYPIYEGRTLQWGLTALEDQQLGGLIMWVPANVVYIVIGLALFRAWLQESERRLSFSGSADVLQRASRGRNA
jgi:putative membrane protein